MKLHICSTQAPELNALMNEAYSGIHQNHIVGCFERLLCDIAAQPEEFNDIRPIQDVVQVSEYLVLNPEAKIVSSKLARSAMYGQKLRISGFGTETCETVYNHCMWTGKTLDEIIVEYSKFSKKYQY